MFPTQKSPQQHSRANTYCAVVRRKCGNPRDPKRTVSCSIHLLFGPNPDGFQSTIRQCIIIRRNNRGQRESSATPCVWQPHITAFRHAEIIKHTSPCVCHHPCLQCIIYEYIINMFFSLSISRLAYTKTQCSSNWIYSPLTSTSSFHISLNRIDNTSIFDAKITQMGTSWILEKMHSIELIS